MATLNNIGPNLQQRLEKAVRELPTVLVNEAVVWTKENFTRQGFPGQGFERWKPRSAKAKRNAGRAILVDTGYLKRSVRKISTGPLRASFGTDAPYARAHNEGYSGVVNVKAHKRGKIGNVKMSTGKTGKPYKLVKKIVGYGQVRSHSRKMNLPRRQFIGMSPVLASILRRKATVHVGRIMKA